MAKKSILIVEDELSLLRILDQKFKQSGFSVLQAKDGLEGLASGKQHHPDLMLVDIILPRLDGIDMLKQIRREGGEWGKKVPMILLTNLSDADKAAEAMEHGVFDYLVKADWKLEDVVKKVNEKLGL